MVTLALETATAVYEYAVASGLESVLGGALRYTPKRAVDAKTWLAVGDGLSDVRSASVTLNLRRTDPLDPAPLTDLASVLEHLSGATVRIDGADVFHAQVVRSEWAVVDRAAYPWVTVNVDLWLVNPEYVDGKGLLANGSSIVANGATVYVNGDRL